MPADHMDTCLISDTIQASLKGHQLSLEDKLQSSAKKILLTRIEFEQSTNLYSYQLDKLKSKYVHLNGTKVNAASYLSAVAATVVNGHGSTANGNGTSNGNGMPVSGPPQPKYRIYDPSLLKLNWPQPQRIGAGLINLGNTCFLNATLQCLTYTAPLANWAGEAGSQHVSECRVAGFCAACELVRHLKRAVASMGTAIKPYPLLQNLKCISKSLHWGRQEDAHEFLILLLETVQKGLQPPGIKLDKLSKETTVINAIFGGYSLSRIVCQRCALVSETFDPQLIWPLDIRHHSHISHALAQYTTTEVLRDDNAYMCARCKTKVVAKKKVTVSQLPSVLVLQLKRFTGLSYGKITKHIEYPETLDIRQYMTHTKGPPARYSLYAVLIHSGFSCNSGHYYCFVRNSNGIWYQMNDSVVSQASVQEVLRQNAYLLFYVKHVEKNGMVVPDGGSQGAAVSSLNGNASVCLSSVSVKKPSIIKHQNTPLICSTPGRVVSTSNGSLLTSSPQNGTDAKPRLGVKQNEAKPASGLKIIIRHGHVINLPASLPKEASSSQSSALSAVSKPLVSYESSSDDETTAPNGTEPTKPSAARTSPLLNDSSVDKPTKDNASEPSPKPRPVSLDISSRRRHSSSDGPMRSPKGAAQKRTIDSLGLKLHSPQQPQPKRKKLTANDSESVCSNASSCSSGTSTTTLPSSSGVWLVEDLLDKPFPNGNSDKNGDRKDVHNGSDPAAHSSVAAVQNGVHSKPRHAIERLEKPTPADSGCADCNGSAATDRTSEKTEQQHVPAAARNGGGSLNGSVASDEQSALKAKHKKAKKRKKKKRKHSSSESEEETKFVWVEKTKENSASGKTENATAWLTNHSSGMRGFGRDVGAWDGGQSEVQRGIDADRKSAKLQQFDDLYDDGLDQGKTKKIRQRMPDTCKSANQFQRTQDFRNRSEQARKSM